MRMTRTTSSTTTTMVIKVPMIKDTRSDDS
jgi:hypothetical protein